MDADDLKSNLILTVHEFFLYRFQIGHESLTDGTTWNLETGI
jgi:hypothetical protein